MSKGKLTQKQENFSLYLFEGMSQRVAYRKAFPSSKKWSDATVDNRASELAKSDEILGRLKSMREKVEERSVITIEKTVKELAKIAFMKEADFYNDDGSVKKLSELTEDQKAALASYEFKQIKEGFGDDAEYIDVPVFRSQDKLKALDMIMKHLGAYEKDNEQSKQKVEVVINAEEVKKVITNFDDEY